MRVALSVDGDKFLEPEIIPTPQDFEQAMREFSEIFERKSKQGEIAKVAGGIAGVFNRDRTELLQSPHLPKWVGNPIYQRFNEITGVEVHFENDTSMVGLGEAIDGAGRGYDIVVYITISTGVGGTRIVAGEIDASTFNFEPGHQIIDADGTICPDCTAYEDGKSFGHWESMISGTSIKRRYGKNPEDITDAKVWQEIARLVAFGLNNVIVHWSPDIVVLGGGMMKSPGISVSDVSKHLKEILKIYPIHPEIKKAELGDLGGLHGSLAYLRIKERNS